MCLIIFAWQPSASQYLLMAANRDEFHDRPAAPADFWSDAPATLGGRDLLAGGTWLGISRSGRFAAITNIRDPRSDRSPRTPVRSRGELTTGFLEGSSTPLEYLTDVAARNREYNGFNLLIGDAQQLWYLHGGGAPASPQPLGPGVYGLSNAALDVAWPKVIRGRQSMRELLRNSEEAIGHDTLAACVDDRTLADDQALALHGLEGEMARRLSAQFIVSPTYGTRCTTTIQAGKTGTRFRELRFDALGFEEERRSFSL